MKYTDNTINSVYIKRGMCLNGISPFVQKADLAERVLFFTAKLIKDTSRISDMTFWKTFLLIYRISWAVSLTCTRRQ